MAEGRLFDRRWAYWTTVAGMALWLVVVKRALFPEFQQTSDRLVDAAYQFTRNGLTADGWPSLRFPNGDVYISQFGLQGIVFALPARLGVPDDAGFWLARILSALLFAAVAVGFAGVVGRLFGRRSGRIAVVLLALAPWTMLMADSPYWAAGLLFLPLVLTWSRLEQALDGGRLPVFFALLFGAFLLKCLCGYEYLTNIVLSPLVPILFFALRDRWSWKRAAGLGAGAFAAGCAAFVVAMGMHVGLLGRVEGSPQKALALIKERAALRGSGGKDTIGDNGVFVPDDAGYRDLARAYFGGGIPRFRLDEARLSEDKRELYATGKADKIARVMGLTNLLLFLVSAAVAFAASRRAALRPLVWATALALPISLTWTVFAFRHSYVHWHLDHIIFYLPLYVTAIGLLAALLGKGGSAGVDEKTSEQPLPTT